MRIAYFQPIGGASGDMILGALTDLGMPIEHLAADPSGRELLNLLYTAALRDDPNQQAFEVITSDTGSRAASFAELPNAVARVASFEAFMSSYRERVKNGSLSAIN